MICLRDLSIGDLFIFELDSRSRGGCFVYEKLHDEADYEKEIIMGVVKRINTITRDGILHYALSEKVPRDRTVIRLVIENKQAQKTSA